MSRTRFEYTAGRIGGLRIVDLAEGVDQQDVQYVPRPICGRRTSACVEFLRNLLSKIQASYWRRDRNPKFHEASDPGFDEVNSVQVVGWQEDLFRFLALAEALSSV